MSIINDTLDRLEGETLGAAARADLNKPALRTRKTKRTAVRVLTAALVTTFAGSGVLIGYWTELHAGVYVPKAAETRGDAVAAGDAATVVAFNQAGAPPPAGASVQGITPSPQAEPASEPVVEPDPEPTAEPRSEAQPEVPSRPEPTTKTKPAPTPKPEPQADPMPHPDSRPKPQPDPKRQPRASAESRPRSVAPDPAPASVAASQSTRRASIDEAVEQARLALARGLYHQALGALSALQSVPERRADYWLLKGSAHLGLGELERAESSFSAAQGLTPGNVQIAIQRAIIQQEQDDHAAALRILEEAQARHRDVPEVYLNMGYSQQALGAVRQAEASFQAFLRLTEGRSLYRQQRDAIEQWLAQFRTPRS